MHIIDDIIISDQVWETRFACDISRCLGKCCQYGDLGAPISDKEEETIKNNLDNLHSYLSQEQIKFLKAGISETYKGRLHIREIGSNMPCPLSFISEKKEILCSLHAHALTKKIPLLDLKPFWCSLFPLIISKTSEGWLVNLQIPDFCVSIPNPPPILLTFAPLLEVVFGKARVKKIRAAYL